MVKCMSVCSSVCIYLDGWRMAGWVSALLSNSSLAINSLEYGTSFEATQSHLISEVLILSCNSANLSLFFF